MLWGNSLNKLFLGQDETTIYIIVIRMYPKSKIPGFKTNIGNTPLGELETAFL